MSKLLNNIIFFSLITLASFVNVYEVSANTCDASTKFNNRSLGKVTFKRDTEGQILLQVNTHISVGKSNDRGLNLSFDISSSINDMPLKLVTDDVVYHGAITCAETCAGECPSIFGDGVCSGCNCSYNNLTSIPLPGVQDGDVVQLEILAARGGEIDTIVKDNIRRIVFNSRLVQ